MLDSLYVTSKCKKCQHPRDIPLSFFVGLDYKFKNSAIAMCQKCNIEFVVTFDEPKIQ